MAKVGGKRTGAGRKKGSSTRPKITDYFTQKEIDELVDVAKEMSKRDAGMLKFLLEQIYGKANQSVEVSGNEGGPVEIRNLENELKDWSLK